MSTKTKNKVQQTPEEQIRGLWDKVQGLKKTVAKAEKPNWLTGGSFRFNPDSMQGSFDIKTATDMSKLVGGMAHIINMETSHTEAAQIMGVKGEFKYLGYTREEWENDFVTRGGQLDLVKKKALLEKSEARLTQILPVEMKLQLEAESIAESLKDLDEDDE